MRKPDNAEMEVYALIENLEIAAACDNCGHISLSVLGGGPCPHCSKLLLNADKTSILDASRVSLL